MQAGAYTSGGTRTHIAAVAFFLWHQLGKHARLLHPRTVSLHAMEHQVLLALGERGRAREHTWSSRRSAHAQSATRPTHVRQKASYPAHSVRKFLGIVIPVLRGSLPALAGPLVLGGSAQRGAAVRHLRQRAHATRSTHLMRSSGKSLANSSFLRRSSAARAARRAAAAATAAGSMLRRALSSWSSTLGSSSPAPTSSLSSHTGGGSGAGCG